MDNIQYPAPKQEYKVLVYCATYNQSKYIEDALNGFIIQQTDFPFVCMVMDDASTDGEQEVIKQWMERECDMYRAETIDIPTSIVIIVPHKTNPSCTFAFYLLKQNLFGTGKKVYYQKPWREKCEYEALCEGDDYWIDSLKLQKQVDFMEANEECTFCHTGFEIYDQSKNDFIDCSSVITQNSEPYSDKLGIMEDIVDGNKYRIQTLTVLIRSSAYFKAREILKPYEGLFLMGDTQLWLSLLSLGNVYFMPEKTSVYRVNEGSACRSKSVQSRMRFSLSCAEMRVAMADLFELKTETKKKLQSQYQKNLNLYLAYDVDYKYFIPVRYNNLIEYLRFQILRLPIMRFILRKIYS